MARFLPFRKPSQPAGLPAARRISVLGTDLTYRTLGSGAPILLLHWGLGSTYLWRRVMPRLSSFGQVVAVDLPGTGESERISDSTPSTYSLDFQRQSLQGFIDLLDLGSNITLVLHGPASMIGFDWAAHNETAVRAIAHMESICRPAVWPDFEDPFRSQFKRTRFGNVEESIVNSKTFLTEALTRQLLHPPTQELFDAYRRHFELGADQRRSYLASLQQIPLAGQPPRAREIVGEYFEWLKESDVPKLLILGKPGYIITGRMRTVAEALPNQTVVEVLGRHLLPEDAPDGVANLISMWMRSLPDD